MSGSGNSGYIPTWREKFDCTKSNFTVTLTSVDIDVLQKHQQGDLLDLELDKRDIIIVLDGNGEILGTIVHQFTSDLIECIKSGHKYEAKITLVHTPNCKVNIMKK